MLDNDGSSYTEQSDIFRQHKICIIGFDNSNSSGIKTMSFRINIIYFFVHQFLVFGFFYRWCLLFFIFSPSRNHEIIYYI